MFAFAAAARLTATDLWPFLLVPPALALALLAYRRTLPPLAPRRRALLVTLRTISFALLCVVLASPVLQRERTHEERARVAVLVDESASMSAADAPGGPSRSERARAALAALRDELPEDAVDLEVVPFAAQAASPLSVPEYLERTAPAAGAGTDILAALRETGDRLADRNLRAFVLISDGRTTRGEIDAGTATGLRRPVFALGVGDTTPPRDVAIGRVDYDPIAYVDTETELEVRIEASGFRGRETSVRLLQEGRLLHRARLRFDQDRGRSSVRLPVALGSPGRQRFQVVVDPLPEEHTERNNAREIRIEVLKNRLRVLFAASRPDWDVGFLARALGSDPNLRLTLVHRDARSSWIDAGTGRPYAWPSGPAWSRDFDLVVLGGGGADVPVQAARDIAVAVAAGRGLLLLAGRDAGALTPATLEALGPALPVVWRTTRAARFGTLAVRLTPQGRLHAASGPLADLARPDGTIDALPPLLGRWEISPRAHALVLLDLAAEPAAPHLVVGRHGEGQAAVWNGFPLWRGAMTDREPVRRAWLEFTGGLVRWLVQPADTQPVQIALQKRVFESGEEVELRARVLDPQFAPLDGAEVRVEVRRQGQAGAALGAALLEQRSGRPGEYLATLPGMGAGEYEVVVEAMHAGKRIGRAVESFAVDAYSAEFADTRQDADFLRELAAQTRGGYAPVGELESLAQLVPREARAVVRRSELELWDTTPLFLLFVAALGVEWALRKRFGLL